MKLRLELAMSPEKPVPFEHDGPDICIGRDPKCELPLGDGNHSVSWKHARLELTADGAFLRDLESSNGTFLNDCRIDKRTKVKVGDHIRLGQNGPYLKLTTVDLSGSFHTGGLPAPPPPHVAGVNGQSPAPRPMAPPPFATRMLLRLMDRRYRRLWLWSGIGAGCIVLLVAVVLVIQGGTIGWLFGENKKLLDKNEDLEWKIAQASDLASRARSVAENMGAKIPVEGPEIFKRALHSVALIKSKGGTGTGTLIDKQRKYVITAYHVVDTDKSVKVVFPNYDSSGQLLTDYLRYESRSFISGKVILAEPSCDLALIQVESLPTAIKEMLVAKISPSPGERVHIVGNPGAIRPCLWGYNQGSVRQVLKTEYVFRDEKTRAITQHIDAWTVQIQNPTNRGDSGGPLINDRGELIGVVSAGSGGSSVLVDIGIDVREIHALLKRLHP